MQTNTPPTANRFGRVRIEPGVGFARVPTMTGPAEHPDRLATVPPYGSLPPPEYVAVGSRYLLEHLIGQGSYGRVWYGRRRDDGAPVAIKVLREEYAGDPDTLARSLRERLALQGLRHAHLVPVDDLVVEGDTVAIVMEYVDGPDLRRLMRHQTLDRYETLTVLAQVAAALAHVHEAGVLHRDVKPENILVSGRHAHLCARLTDFGLARVSDGCRLTDTSRVLGTLGYTAPELVTGRPYGPAADVYALGVTAYELFCRRRPFDAEHPLAVMRAHVEQPPPQPPGVCPDTWRVLRACLDKRPERRPTAAQLSVYFGQLGRGDGTALPALPAPGAPPAGPDAAPLPGHDELPPTPRRLRSGRRSARARRIIGLAGVLCLALLAGFAGGWASRWSGTAASCGGDTATVRLSSLMVPSPGPAIVRISYCNTGPGPREAQLRVNDGSPTRLEFPTTGGPPVLGTVDTVVTLSAGPNTLTVSAQRAGPAIDTILVLPVADPSAPR